MYAVATAARTARPQATRAASAAWASTSAGAERFAVWGKPAPKTNHGVHPSTAPSSPRAAIRHTVQHHQPRFAAWGKPTRAFSTTPPGGDDATSSPPPPPPPAADAGAAAGGGDIVEVTEENLASAVLQAPMPVILDAYADWCEPCKQLTPLLENLVKASGGRLRLAKINVDEQQALSQQLQIRSLPTVFGIFGGKVVDSFQGMVSEEQLAEFATKLMAAAGEAGGAAEEEPEEDLEPIAQAQKLLEAGDAVGAAGIFNQVYGMLSKGVDGKELRTTDKDVLVKQAQCLVGLAQAALMSDEMEAVTELVSQLKTKYMVEVATTPELSAAVASLELKLDLPEDAGPIAEMEEKLEANADDHETRHALAQQLFAAARFEEAINHGLQLFRRDRDWNEGAAKTLLLKFFDSLGDSHELTKKGRKRLTNMLFV